MKKRGLNGKIQEVLQTITETELDNDIALTFLRQKIRTIQNEHTASYMRIYKLKEKIQK